MAVGVSGGSGRVLAPLEGGRYRVGVADGERSLAQLRHANAEAERRLLVQHARIVAASEQSNADDEHDPEGSTIAFERQQVTALLDQVRSTGEALCRAEAARADGTWGTCETCGGAIGADRLEARPQARTCIACARRTGHA